MTLEHRILIPTQDSPEFTRIWALIQISLGAYEIFSGRLDQNLRVETVHARTLDAQRNLRARLGSMLHWGYSEITHSHPVYQTVIDRIEQHRLIRILQQ
jgi:hypothetical protein